MKKSRPSKVFFFLSKACCYLALGADRHIVFKCIVRCLSELKDLGIKLEKEMTVKGYEEL